MSDIDLGPVVDYQPSVYRFAGQPITVQNTAEYLQNTLDLLALALAGHKHQWTSEERHAYEQATRALGAMPQMLTVR